METNIVELISGNSLADGSDKSALLKKKLPYGLVDLSELPVTVTVGGSTE